MKNRVSLFAISVFIVGGVYCWIGCDRNPCDTAQPEIAAANSYLTAAVKDICGNREQVYDLVPPGMCPGHFDISPSQVNILCHCKILFVFDFQKNIEKAIPRIKERGLKVSQITPSPGMCVPDTYLSIVRQVAAALGEQRPSQKEFYESRLSQIEQRLNDLRRDIEVRMKQSGLQGSKIITSQHQAEFAKWLALKPVSVFAGRDTITPAQIDKNLHQARDHLIQCVIANRQEGTGMAETLADHLNVPCVVFSNFPDTYEQNPETAGYDRLVVENVNRLLEAMQ